MQRLVDGLNQQLFNPAGLNILWPRKVGFIFVSRHFVSFSAIGCLKILIVSKLEIEYYVSWQLRPFDPRFTNGFLPILPVIGACFFFLHGVISHDHRSFMHFYFIYEHYNCLLCPTRHTLLSWHLRDFEMDESCQDAHGDQME